MSKIRDKATKIAEEGAATRGNYTPKAGSVPTRLYTYWASKAPFSSVPSNVGRQENFCHFWRVVTIWAPLYFLTAKINKVTSARLFPVITGVVTLCLTIGFIFLSSNTFDVLMTLGLVALSVIALAAVGFGLAEFHERLDKPGQDRFERYAFRAFIGVGASFIAFLLVVVFVESPQALLVILVPIVFFWLGFKYLIPFVADRLEASRLREQAKFDAMTRQELEDFVNNLRDKESEPSGFEKFFGGIGDIIIFIAQVLRVKKYKICPLVTVPLDSKSQV